MSAEIEVPVEQGTDAWRLARSGCVTASRLSDVLAKIKSGEAAGRANYRAQLVAERLTGLPSDDIFESAAMRRGTECEPAARRAYEAAKDVLVDKVGFVAHPTIKGAGGSPDGLVGEDAGVEIKCPNTATHIDTMIRDEVPAKYVPQMQWLMACTGRKTWDFVSYDDRLPDDLALFIKALPRDDSFIQAAEREVERFLAEVDETVTKLRARMKSAVPTCLHILMTPERIAAVHARNRTPVCPDCGDEIA